MRPKTIEMIKKVENLLTENEYLWGDVLADKCHLSVSSIYRIIRLMRLNGTGIHITTKGYCLSEFSTVRDDVHFLRRLNGRRTSDLIAISAAARSIKKRWKSVEDKKTLGLILGPLLPDGKLLEAGLEAIEAFEDKKGLKEV